MEYKLWSKMGGSSGKAKKGILEQVENVVKKRSKRESYFLFPLYQDICPLADTDFSQIISDNSLQPDRGFLIKLDIAYDLSCRRYENRFMNFKTGIFVCVKGHGILFV